MTQGGGGSAGTITEPQGHTGHAQQTRLGPPGLAGEWVALPRGHGVSREPAPATRQTHAWLGALLSGRTAPGPASLPPSPRAASTGLCMRVLQPELWGRACEMLVTPSALSRHGRDRRLKGVLGVLLSRQRR